MATRLINSNNRPENCNPPSGAVSFRQNFSGKKSLENQWHITYDNQREAFLLLAVPLDEATSRNSSIKRLTVQDFDNFDIFRRKSGKKILQLEPKLLNANNSCRPSLYCVNCKNWFKGQCYKHPLIFVHEKVPSKSNYLCTDTFPKFLKLAPSAIPGAGHGVFTILPLPAGLCFGPYSGILEDSKSSEVSGYSWRISKNGIFLGWVDANSMFYSNWMRYVNCPRFEKEQNMLGVLYKGQIYYLTYRPIQAGEELMVWYGQDYGIFLQVPNASTHRGLLAPKNKSLQEKVQGVEGRNTLLKNVKTYFKSIAH